jgi:signal transduction histidine kinase
MKFPKLKYEIAFYFIILILCFSIVSGSLFLSQEYKSQIENYKSTCSSILKNIEPNVAELLYVEDIVGLKRIVNGIKQSNEDFIYCFVLDAEKKVVVHTFEGAFPSELLKVNTGAVQNTELLDFGNSSAYDFCYPVVGGKLGTIRIGVSRERLISDINSYLIKRVVILLFFILLGIAVAFYLSRLITNPLSELVDSAKKISAGDFNQMVAVTSKDEIGNLSVSFNTMSLSLKSMTENLENKVKQLYETNEEYLALNEEYEAQNHELLIAKDKAEDCDRLKTAFLANLSHEIRTPMNGILGFVELLKEKDLKPEVQAEYILVIEQCGQRMLNLISDLVDISRIEAGQIKIVPEKFNMDVLLNKIYRLLKPMSESKGIELLIEKPVSLNKTTVFADSAKLEQIILNLLNNAIKFTNKGKIQFGYEVKGKNLQFSVKDTGRGIPENMRSVIFERFRQVDDVNHKSESGSGLGLAICKSFVELMGGSIWVESEVNKGSVFYFTIPYITSDKEVESNKKILQKPESSMLI